MSAEEDDGPGTREVAHRLFAAEFEDSDFSYAESDEERAPNYVVTPTGARVNRLFAVGVLTEVEPVGEDVLRGRIVDPTGAFVVYAGQYQPDAQTFLERAQPPAFVAVTGKARTFQPDDSDVVYTSIRPESVNEVDAETRDRWVVNTVERTLDRTGVAATALASDARGDDLAEQLRTAGVEDSLAAGLPLAIEHYGTTGAYLTAVRDLALDAARVVAGDREEVGSLSLAPDEGGDGDLAALASLDLESPAPETGVDTATAVSDDPSTADSRAGTAGADDGATTAETDADPGIESEPASATNEPASDAGASASEPETGSGSEEIPEPDTETEPVESSVTEETTGVDSAVETDAVATDPDDTAPSGAAGGSSDIADSEPATEPDSLGDSESATEPDSLGDSESAADDIGDFDPDEFDLDDEVREEVESEYGTEFQSGTEVEEPGEADIETPDPEELADAEASEAESAGESTGAEPSASGAADATDPGSDADAAAADAAPKEATATAEADAEAAADATDEDADAEPAEDIDVEDAVMDAMEALDDGDGADREAVIERVVDRTGASPDEVEDAIQSALMDGRCYEPDDTSLKPI